MSTLSSDEIRRIISDVAPEQSFWMSDGHVVKNLYELLDNLQRMSQDTFAYHVNATKNDFEPWTTSLTQFMIN